MTTYGWYWLSFCDADRPAGQQFLGACVIRAASHEAAVLTAHALGCNPGGEVMIQGPSFRDFAPEWTGRLLTREECEAFERAYGAEGAPS